MEKRTVYIETSVISYLTAKESSDLYAITRQRYTWRWWHDRQRAFDIVSSELVHLECAQGDEEAAKRRLELVGSMRLLPITDKIIELSRRIMTFVPLPPKAQGDALHIAVALQNGIDYLLTWNLKHIANAEVSRRVELLSRAEDRIPPVLCTPEQLLEDVK